MAITITTLQGSSSIAADRITINDNFSTIIRGLNNLLGVLDTTTGKFDNTEVGSNNVIITEGLTITQSGIDVTKGDIGIGLGNLLLNSDGSYIQFGSTNRKVGETLLPKITISTNNFSALDFSTFDVARLPRIGTTDIADINVSNLIGGEILYNIDTGKPSYYDAISNTWVVL